MSRGSRQMVVAEALGVFGGESDEERVKQSGVGWQPRGLGCQQIGLSKCVSKKAHDQICLEKPLWENYGIWIGFSNSSQSLHVHPCS